MKLDFSHITQMQGVYYLTPENPVLSTNYLAVREKEGRILSDEDIRKLPYLDQNEWAYRIKSTERFTEYIAGKSRKLHILTIGCGNGWFAHKISTVSTGNEVIGLDVNREELEQAARIFKKENLRFVYADIFKISEFFKNSFDIIVLNGTIQYFADFEELFKLLQTFLVPKGEIHIIDSPFYASNEIKAAKKRTQDYYENLGVPEMTENYHHHNEKHVIRFEKLYTYKKNFLHKIIGKKDSPFSWYRWIKT